MDEIALKLCDIQGRLFELSANQKYDSIKFIRVFMNSDVSRALDSKYNRMQWAGEEYLLDSKKIYKQAPVEVMKRNYMMFHTMDPVLAIEDLKKIYNQKK